MKKILLFCVFSSTAAILFAQRQTYDLVSYVPPAGWRNEVKNNLTSYTRTDSKKGRWCQISIVKSTISKGGIEADFESEWQELAIKNYNPTSVPQTREAKEADGWKMKTGIAKFVFNNDDAMVMLTTISGYNRCVSILAAMNSEDYLKDIDALLASIHLEKQEPDTQQLTAGYGSVIGSWGKSNTVGQINNRFGNYSYNKQQYTFNPNGTYSFAAKTYNDQYAETLLVKEDGIFAIDRNSITITPKNSVTEAWTKRNGADNWNELKSTQKRPLEIVTYEFSIAGNNLLMQTAKQTERDGAFNNGNTYTYGSQGTFTPIALPGGDHITSEELQREPVKETVAQPNASGTNSGFAFASTNFDDGWTSTVREDWVEVTKGSMKVLLHYPKEGTIFPADPGPLTNAAWNILVAPRYRDLKNYKTSYIATSDRPYLGMGYATETATGKDVFIVFFHQGQTAWLEFIAPDKSTFMKQYKFDPETIQWDSDTDLMIPLANMTGYNKFAVAASDFKGKWTSDFTGIQQMYHVYTGQYAGMNINQSNEEFIFSAGNSYSWRLLAVNGMVGNVKVTDVKSTGLFTVPNNWQVQFSKIESGARTYHAFWSCIKGARLLNLLDANSPGSGIYTKYGLAK